MSQALKCSAMLSTGVMVAMAAVVSGAHAQTQANCQWYGTTALKQQQENERLKCGLLGPAWTSDLRAHIAWCASVGADTWRQAARQRDQDLAACVAKRR